MKSLEEIDREAIVRTLITKEERRRLERAALIAQLEKDSIAEDSPSEERTKDNGSAPIHTKCPYLDTIDRKILDFDFEKLCSISLSHMNVYCCLICGAYFQGRGKGTHAYVHALETVSCIFTDSNILEF